MQYDRCAHKTYDTATEALGVQLPVRNCCAAWRDCTQPQVQAVPLSAADRRMGAGPRMISLAPRM